MSRRPADLPLRSQLVGPFLAYVRAQRGDADGLIGGSLGYRFHLRGLGDSPFFGVSAGYKTGFGKHGHDHGGGGADEAPSILRLNIRQRSILGNLGYRWVWNSGFRWASASASEKSRCRLGTLENPRGSRGT
jgi:hypothetical protein